jgi:hypothetical protein
LVALGKIGFGPKMPKNLHGHWPHTSICTSTYPHSNGHLHKGIGNAIEPAFFVTHPRASKVHGCCSLCFLCSPTSTDYIHTMEGVLH